MPPSEAARRLIVLGVTGGWAFAAGCLLLALGRHLPRGEADILLLHDADLAPGDKRLFERLGARCERFAPPPCELHPEARRMFSPLCLAKLSCFGHLERYARVLWLDADCLVQDSLEGIWNCGPFSLALEDPEFGESGQTSSAGINLHGPVPGFDGEAPNLNSGVLLLGNEFSRFAAPARAQAFCLDFLQRHGPLLRYPDQAALNALARHLERETPGAFSLLPGRFNCHPRNGDAALAPVVHAFGAYKPWNDAITAACFPEWQRDYARWRRLGGSRYAGPVENEAYGGSGAFYLLRGLFATIERSETALTRLSRQLDAERTARQKLESLVGRLRPTP